jgi:hypothetical protein
LASWRSVFCLDSAIAFSRLVLTISTCATRGLMIPARLPARSLSPQARHGQPGRADPRTPRAARAWPLASQNRSEATGTRR